MVCVLTKPTTSEKTEAEITTTKMNTEGEASDKVQEGV